MKHPISSNITLSETTPIKEFIRSFIDVIKYSYKDFNTAGKIFIFPIFACGIIFIGIIIGFFVICERAVYHTIRFFEKLFIK